MKDYIQLGEYAYQVHMIFSEKFSKQIFYYVSYRVSEQHRTININANTVQISDNASITMSSNTSVDENRRHFEVDEPENQRQQEIEN